MVRPTLVASPPPSYTPAVIKQKLSPCSQTAAYRSLARYRTEPKEFQAGGTGNLYVAQDKYTKELVAIKVIQFRDKSQRKAYETETAILSKMKTSGALYTIVMKEHFIYQNSGYIVLELLEEDLYSRSEHFATVKEVKNIFKQICKGVAELHDNGIAHLDLKPENILVDRLDQAKICDFGSSLQWTGKSPLCFEYVGSDFYLAPEIFSHKRGYDAPRADIWSLGILLHMMIADQHPFAGETHQQSLGNYFCSKISFDELKMVCPDDVMCHDLLARMLNKNPMARPSISEILSHPWFSPVLSSQ